MTSFLLVNLWADTKAEIRARREAVLAEFKRVYPGLIAYTKGEALVEVELSPSYQDMTEKDVWQLVTRAIPEEHYPSITLYQGVKGDIEKTPDVATFRVEAWDDGELEARNLALDRAKADAQHIFDELCAQGLSYGVSLSLREISKVYRCTITPERGYPSPFANFWPKEVKGSVMIEMEVTATLEK